MDVSRVSISEIIHTMSIEDEYTDRKEKKRRVKFSEPLEYWREFDRETGELCKEKTGIELKKATSQHWENIQDVEKLGKGYIFNSADQTETEDRSQTDCRAKDIHFYQTGKETRMRKAPKLVEDKAGRDCIFESEQNMRQISSSLHKKGLVKKTSPCNVERRSRTNGNIEQSLRTDLELPHIKSYCMSSVSLDIGKVPPPPFPFAGSRKIYDERLLPSSFVSAKRIHSSSKIQGPEVGFPPVVGKLRTPHIVQLFD